VDDFAAGHVRSSVNVGFDGRFAETVGMVASSATVVRGAVRTRSRNSAGSVAGRGRRDPDRHPQGYIDSNVAYTGRGMCMIAITLPPAVSAQEPACGPDSGPVVALIGFSRAWLAVPRSGGERHGRAWVLEIVTGVGQIEAFVGQREIGDDRVRHGDR
jgi:hypothetical protein